MLNLSFRFAWREQTSPGLLAEAADKRALLATLRLSLLSWDALRRDQVAFQLFSDDASRALASPHSSENYG